MVELVRDRVEGVQEASAIVAEVAAGFRKTSSLPAYARAEALFKVGRAIEAQSEDFARLICSEVRKPIKDARREVERAVATFRLAGEEAKRQVGEVVPLDLDEASAGRLALTRRFPRGPALLITPFNFPLNLVAHKVAPAMAVGASFALKPAPQAPATALKLGRLIRAAGWPAQGLAVCPTCDEVAEALVKDERFAVLSFTGSAAVGWRLKSLAGKKHVVLELGGNAGVLVAADADLDRAARRCAWGAYCYSGQVCISVQRIYVEAPVYDRFKELILKRVSELKVGDPADERTDVGPLISDAAARRVADWLQEALDAGARILAGGGRKGDLIEPALVEGAAEDCRLSAEEVFGPVAVLARVGSKAEGLERLACGRYGLQAGIFTKDMGTVLAAWGSVPVGGLIVNDVPTFRSDAMPYGGVKDSGIGREGVRHAMEEYTEIRTLVVKI
ncbi:MAG: aldehyde dehydrogenase family protein [Elusimicrobia bacterium]|nr:aldehyde dehydrogenase family protein [Elusimicrobiota bacterium]